MIHHTIAVIVHVDYCHIGCSGGYNHSIGIGGTSSATTVQLILLLVQLLVLGPKVNPITLTRRRLCGRTMDGWWWWTKNTGRE